MSQPSDPVDTPPPPPQGAAKPPSVQLRIEDVINRFHSLYYDLGQIRGETWERTYWMGVPVQKVPGDLLMYQELLHRIRPRLVIETGTRTGGSALFLCQMLDLIEGVIGGGGASVVTVDVETVPNPPQHPRLTYLTGSSTDRDILRQLRERAAGVEPVLVILDSDHTRDHVLSELRLYHDLVTLGSYLIVEDTNVNGHPAYPQHGPGPMEALEIFMAENSQFERDAQCEKFLLTFNPGGFLRRRTGTPPTAT